MSAHATPVARAAAASSALRSAFHSDAMIAAPLSHALPSRCAAERAASPAITAPAANATGATNRRHRRDGSCSSATSSSAIDPKRDSGRTLRPRRSTASSHPGTPCVRGGSRSWPRTTWRRSPVQVIGSSRNGWNANSDS